MRLLFSLFLLFSYYLSLAQKDSFPSPFEFRLVDSVQASKSELYTRARSWFASKYNSSKEVLQMDDKEAGKLIGKAITSWPLRGGFGNLLCESPINYTITVEVKDGKYRCVLSSFYHEGCFTGKETTIGGGSLNNGKPAGSPWLGGLTAGQWQKLKSKASRDAELLMVSLKAAMHANTEAESKEGGF